MSRIAYQPPWDSYEARCADDSDIPARTPRTKSTTGASETPVAEETPR